MTKYYVQLENTLEELQELFIKRYVEIMECDEEWAKEDVERTLKMLCNLNGVPYVK